MTPDPKRRAALAKIHVAKKLLRLSDELYRAIIARVTGGKRSSAVLDTAERGRLLDELGRLGFQSRGTKTRVVTAIAPDARGGAIALPVERKEAAAAHPPHAAGQARKIRMLWRKLGKAAKLRDASERGLRHFVRRQTGRDALQWLTAHEANDVIEGLKAWHRRLARPE
jgi:phage gp16-like protein